MTRTLLNDVAKAKNINLDYYDVVYAWINEKYTYLHIILSSVEVIGGRKQYISAPVISFRVSDIERKAYSKGTPEAWEYTTNGIENISELK